MKVNPILSCDWLQVHVKHPTPDIGGFHTFFQVKKMPYGTRHFSVVEELYQHGKRIATVTRKPNSTILQKDMCLIKFDNWVLYEKNLHTWVTNFLNLNELKFMNISRIDICQDMTEFENKMLPGLFIKKYANATHLKLGKAKKTKAVFTQQATTHEYESLRFGSMLSEISYYLYNKTKEMNEVKWKPWIAEKWKKGFLDITKDKWRLEFSLKSSAKMIVNTGTGETKELNNLQILLPEYMELFFCVLREKFFRFVWNDGQARRGRMRELKLFARKFGTYALIDCEGKTDASRSDKIFIKKLEEINSDLRGTNFDLSINGEVLKQAVIESKGLQEWAMYKGLFTNKSLT